MRTIRVNKTARQDFGTFQRPVPDYFVPRVNVMSEGQRVYIEVVNEKGYTGLTLTREQAHDLITALVIENDHV